MTTDANRKAISAAMAAQAGFRACWTCDRSWARSSSSAAQPSDDVYSCGAGVDDAALAEGLHGRNPIWAERKYGTARLLAMLLDGDATVPDGSDCENMRGEDGADCALWTPRQYRKRDE